MLLGIIMKEHRMKLGELRERLKLYPDECEVTFGSGNLQFYRVKPRGENLIQIEFSQNTDMVLDTRGE
jgi:hypothetical protein